MFLLCLSIGVIVLSFKIFLKPAATRTAEAVGRLKDKGKKWNVKREKRREAKREKCNGKGENKKVKRETERCYYLHFTLELLTLYFKGGVL